MEWAKTYSPIPIQDVSGQPISDPKKAEVLASHYYQKNRPFSCPPPNSRPHYSHHHIHHLL
ncbi:hypothetical protein E2C01_063509 [Portunus trituberculatus]|uniref:Uncharacterized protein n=1 Tax=Portunus trituberculatus TaxID=210409 RepID=A0A5B7HAM9_PORTR|nr:hypothetical protein [Portunus trituberculatus]